MRLIFGAAQSTKKQREALCYGKLAPFLTSSFAVVHLMTRNMKFSHKILLAAALVVAVAFACFILFNDYQQRQTLRSSTESSMQELGSLTTSNIQTWLESRIHLLQSMSQQVSADGSALSSLKRVIDLPAYTGNFQLSYFGGTDGVMFSVPAGNRAADYDPRARGWYKAANSAQQTIVTEPYIAASSGKLVITCLLYTSPSPRDRQKSRMPSSA